MAGGRLCQPPGNCLENGAVSGDGVASPTLIVADIPVSLYVHIPWCVRKCPYCDFNSHAVVTEIDQAAYIDALLSDFVIECGRQPLNEIHSIFIGGGTPSLFDEQQIGRLLEGVNRRVALSADIEITLEANPGTAEARRFAGYRAAGVNRLSIGVQSFDDAKLSALGRIHNSAEARSAIAMARAAGFDNLNLDLMYALPAQTSDEALSDLNTAIDLGPTHLSWYQLTLEPNTLFHHKPPSLPGDDEVADMMDAGLQRLDETGFRRYEISAYASSDRQCRHNLNYWRFGDYIGIGAGAHGKRTERAGRIWRRSKQRQPAAYLAQAARGAVLSESLVARDSLGVEFFLNALRLVDGVPLGFLADRAGLTLDDVAEPLCEARRCGLMDPDPAVLRPTRLGLDFLNDLLAIFEPDA